VITGRVPWCIGTEVSCGRSFVLFARREQKNRHGLPPCTEANALQINKQILTKLHINTTHSVRFEVFTAVTMKNGVFWDVTL
jgi:hypothetical protein